MKRKRVDSFSSSGASDGSGRDEGGRLYMDLNISGQHRQDSGEYINSDTDTDRVLQLQLKVPLGQSMVQEELPFDLERSESFSSIMRNTVNKKTPQRRDRFYSSLESSQSGDMSCTDISSSSMLLRKCINENIMIDAPHDHDRYHSNPSANLIRNRRHYHRPLPSTPVTPMIRGQSSVKTTLDTQQAIKEGRSGPEINRRRSIRIQNIERKKKEQRENQKCSLNEGATSSSKPDTFSSVISSVKSPMLPESSHPIPSSYRQNIFFAGNNLSEGLRRERSRSSTITSIGSLITEKEKQSNQKEQNIWNFKDSADDIIEEEVKAKEEEKSIEDFSETPKIEDFSETPKISNSNEEMIPTSSEINNVVANKGKEIDDIDLSLNRREKKRSQSQQSLSTPSYEHLINERNNDQKQDKRYPKDRKNETIDMEKPTQQQRKRQKIKHKRRGALIMTTRAAIQLRNIMYQEEMKDKVEQGKFYTKEEIELGGLHEDLEQLGN